MCEQMGWEPKEEELPQDGTNLSLECQQALTILNALLMLSKSSATIIFLFINH